MRTGLCWALAALASSAMPQAAAAADQIVVPEVTTTAVESHIGPLVTELILEALLNRHGVRALGPSDMKDMLDVEQQKMLLGCDQSSCMAELAGAMGANRVIAGMVGRLGTLYVVTLKLVDTKSAQVLARASRRFEKVEQVPEAVGPLVDDLLSAKPRATTMAPILDTTAKPETKPEAMLVREACKVAEQYARKLMEQPYSTDRVKERRSILEDTLYTPFLKQFDEKVVCIKSHGGQVFSKLIRELRAATTEKEADDRRRRILEWREMYRLIELLEEAYRVGFEKEKSGAGARPAQLPFRVSPREPDAPEDTEAVRRYLDDYVSAQKVLGQALEAGRKGQEKRFRQLWTPDDPKKSRTSIEYTFKSVADYTKNGYAVDLCPIFVIAAEDIESYAERYAKDGTLQACFRRQKADYVTTDTVYMKKMGSTWRIDRW